jgi:DNA mismatch repair protein MutH
MKFITRKDATGNLKKYIGRDLRKLALDNQITTYETGKQNKGWKGLVLERLAGLETNVSKAPNGLTFELKSIAFKNTIKGLVPKETMAITMINPEELKTLSFYESHCWAKFKAMIICAVEWNGTDSEDAKLLKVVNLDFEKNDELIKEIKADYELIQNILITQGFDELSGKYGKWIQARTKGAKNSKSRAFYARTKLIKKIFDLFDSRNK